MILFTMGFTQKSAEVFFDLINKHQIEMLIDIRRNNSSQLAGFSKSEDLKFFLAKICQCEYEHRIDFAPEKDTLERYKKKKIDWEQYVSEYVPLMQSRKAPEEFVKRYANFNNVCILCSEPTPEHCHRRLFAELIKSCSPNGITIVHI